MKNISHRSAWKGTNFLAHHWLTKSHTLYTLHGGGNDLFGVPDGKKGGKISKYRQNNPKRLKFGARTSTTNYVHI